MKNCFNCIHKKTDLWNFNYSDKEAHTCAIDNNDLLHNFRSRVEGKFREEIENNTDYELDCCEISEHQKKFDEFVNRTNEIFDKLNSI